MGDQHQEQWMQRLPFTLLGKRISYQPDLDASSAELVLGVTPTIPGALIGQAPSLTKSEIHKLLNTLHQKAARPQKPMSRHNNDPHIYMPEETKNATHVYVRLDKGNPLAPRFARPFPIVSRPSKSTITIKEGTFVSGLPKLRTHHWSLCQVGHMRPKSHAEEDLLPSRRPKPY